MNLPLDIWVSTREFTASLAKTESYNIMLIQTFEAIQSLQKGQPITALSGRITNVYPQENKVGNNGPYTQQNVVITDGKSNLRLTLFDFDPIGNDVVGQQIWLEQGKNGKGVFAGLKANPWVRTQGPQAGQTTWSVDVSGVAILTWTPPGATAPAAHAPVTQQASTPLPQQAIRELPPVARPAQPSDINGVKKALAREMIAYDLCLGAAIAVADHRKELIGHVAGEGVSATDIKDIATTFYIQGSRNGLFNAIPNNWSAYAGGQATQQPAPQPPPPVQQAPPPQVEDDSEVPF